MKPQTAIIKLRTRLNKLHSSDYDNIPDWVAVESINKAALELTRDAVAGRNPTQEGAEETRLRVDDLQFLLKPVPKFKGNDDKELFFEGNLPEDYLYFNRIMPKASKGNCSGQDIISRLREEANVPELLNDWSWQPDWGWRHSFHTVINNKLRIYKNGQFNIDYVDFVYYRKPKKMDIFGYTHEDGTDSEDVDLEFKDDLAEIIIDYAASIIAGDIESVNQAQTLAAKGKTNI